MKSHWIWMVIGCGLPLLLIFFAPALGITGYNGLFAFIILMFVVHLFIPHGSHGRGGHNHGGHSDKKHGESKEEVLDDGDKKGHEGHRHH
ncbi:hypothetical protein AB8P51_11000 [Muriicola sp. SD30]|uniref:hypothetical protein n=1 Tax=Muriicola sp. SD30 TaxID=3240936 RepID=UPI00350F2049